ncbi:hypothetical protein GOQ30_09865 [Flavobacterium sp. TP390]|uniref:Uncharacterized protein n=1 Tax=Flavobacterium profundi TaxID=1774945 RepID=A0A6I4ILU8_9FLAO|nr:hypothetical protein [Flavobacterium profundi]MVO09462.1 hypothetical protein [Flavobacterium profundi]
MKKTITLLFLFLSFHSLRAQENTNENQENQETTANSLQAAELTLSQYKKLKEKLEDLKETFEKSDQETIGYLVFKLNNATLHSENGTDTVVDINSIYISLKDGYINDLTVYYNNQIYTNKNAPIPVTHSRFTKITDKISALNGTDFFVFQEIIEPKRLNQFVPDDVDYSTETDLSELELKKGVGINNIFDIRLYSDALALFGNEENGLVQTDLRYKNILHRRTLINSVFYLQYFKVNINASKFDSKDKYIEFDNFNNSDILRKSYLNAEVAVNLLNSWIEFKSQSRAYLDTGFGVGATKLRTATDTLNVNNTNFFIEGGLNLKSSSNIGLDVYGRMTRLFSPGTQTYAEYLNGQYFNFLKFGLDFYWHPFDDKANRLFARVNYITPTQDIDKTNDFFQFQIGYSVMLSDLIK